MGRSSPFLHFSFVFTRQDQIDFSLDKLQAVSEQSRHLSPGWVLFTMMVHGADLLVEGHAGPSR